MPVTSGLYTPDEESEFLGFAKVPAKRSRKRTVRLSDVKELGDDDATEKCKNCPSRRKCNGTIMCDIDS